MKLLVLFAAWARDDRSDSAAWLQWYREILTSRFAGDDVFVAVSHHASSLVERNFEDLPGLLGMRRVSAEQHVDSDASQYQLCLSECRDVLKDYDYVLMLHTKGASYDFASFGSWRASVAESIFDRGRVADLVADGRPRLVAERGHLLQSGESIHQCARLADRLGIVAPPFAFAAATTLYYAPGPMLFDFAQRLPDAYFSENLLELGENRFFFEGHVPSTLVVMGASPEFVGGAVLNPLLHAEISYDGDPVHNSYLVLREHRRRGDHGAAYRQAATPYAHGPLSEVASLQIAFERYSHDDA